MLSSAPERCKNHVEAVILSLDILLPGLYIGSYCFA